jgi:hypothetical protein
MKALLSHANPLLVIPLAKRITSHKDPTKQKKKKKSDKNGRSMQKKHKL